MLLVLLIDYRPCFTFPHHGLLTRTVLESIGADALQDFGQGDVGEGCAFPEGEFMDFLNALRNHYAGEASAAVECPIFNHFYASRDIDAHKIRAVDEGAFPYLSRSVRNDRVPVFVNREKAYEGVLFRL